MFFPVSAWSVVRSRRRRPRGVRSHRGFWASVAAAALGGLVVLGAGPAATTDITRGPSPTYPTFADLQASQGSEALRQLGAGVAERVVAELGQVTVEAPDADAVAHAFAAHDLGHLFRPQPVYIAADGEEIDAERLHAWLASRDSPLQAYAEDLVAAGIEHDVDPRLVVGIAAIESEAGKRLPPGSHNAWGWSGTGPHGLHAWPSWPVAIDEFTEGLARVYDTSNVDETMARKYVPPNWEHWLSTVLWVIDDI